MTDKQQLNQHTSQITRLEQVMTALAEAQVKTEDDARELRQALIQLAGETRQLKRSMGTLAAAQAKTETTMKALAKQFQAYLTTRKN